MSGPGKSGDIYNDGEGEVADWDDGYGGSIALMMDIAQPSVKWMANITTVRTNRTVLVITAH